jgi:hypothetical protein
VQILRFPKELRGAILLYPLEPVRNPLGFRVWAGVLRESSNVFHSCSPINLVLDPENARAQDGSMERRWEMESSSKEPEFAGSRCNNPLRPACTATGRLGKGNPSYEQRPSDILWEGPCEGPTRRKEYTFSLSDNFFDL